MQVLFVLVDRWMFVDAWKPPRKGDTLYTPSVMLGKLRQRLNKYELNEQKELCAAKVVRRPT